MNKIIDIRVDLNTDTSQSPSVFCLFDSIETDHLIFDLAQSTCSSDFKSKSVLCQNTDLSGGNLLAIDNDLAVWYYYSAINQNYLFPSPTKLLKVRYESQVLETTFEGLWSSSAEATNFWFPETMVMEIRASRTRDEFNSSIGCHMGAVAETVTKLLKLQGWRVGLVLAPTRYVGVEPLLQDGSPKLYRSKLLRTL